MFNQLVFNPQALRTGITFDVELSSYNSIQTNFSYLMVIVRGNNIASPGVNPSLFFDVTPYAHNNIQNRYINGSFTVSFTTGNVQSNSVQFLQKILRYTNPPLPASGMNQFNRSELGLGTATINSILTYTFNKTANTIQFVLSQSLANQYGEAIIDDYMTQVGEPILFNIFNI